MLALGAYTLSDPARVLGLPLPKLRVWMLGREASEALRHRGAGKNRAFGFHLKLGFRKTWRG